MLLFELQVCDSSLDNSTTLLVAVACALGTALMLLYMESWESRDQGSSFWSLPFTCSEHCKSVRCPVHPKADPALCNISTSHKGCQVVRLQGVPLSYLLCLFFLPLPEEVPSPLPPCSERYCALSDSACVPLLKST